MRANIEQHKKDIEDAKSRHVAANKDIKRIEKDMNEFSDNKDSKLAELQSALDSLKKALNKSSISVKTLQKELQASRLDSEQAGSDLTSAEEQLAEVDTTLKSQQEEVEALKKEQAQCKVSDWMLYILRGNTSNELYRKHTILPKHSLKTNKPSSQASTMSCVI